MEFGRDWTSFIRGWLNSSCDVDEIFATKCIWHFIYLSITTTFPFSHTHLHIGESMLLLLILSFQEMEEGLTEQKPFFLHTLQWRRRREESERESVCAWVKERRDCVCVWERERIQWDLGSRFSSNKRFLFVSPMCICKMWMLFFLFWPLNRSIFFIYLVYMNEWIVFISL